MPRSNDSDGFIDRLFLFLLWNGFYGSLWTSPSPWRTRSREGSGDSPDDSGELLDQPIGEEKDPTLMEVARGWVEEEGQFDGYMFGLRQQLSER